MHETYGIDLEQAMTSRSWRWFRVRALGLYANPATRLARRAREATTPKPAQP